MRPLKKWASAVQLSQSKIEASKVVDVTGSMKYGRFQAAAGLFLPFPFPGGSLALAACRVATRL